MFSTRTGFFVKWVQENHRTAKLEGTLKDDLVQPFLGKGACMSLSSTLSHFILKPSSNRVSTTSPGKLFQGLTILTAK